MVEDEGYSHRYGDLSDPKDAYPASNCRIVWGIGRAAYPDPTGDNSPPSSLRKLPSPLREAALICHPIVTPGAARFSTPYATAGTNRTTIRRRMVRHGGTSRADRWAPFGWKTAGEALWDQAHASQNPCWLRCL